MLQTMSDVFVSLGRNTIDATRAFGRSDATVVALVLSMVVIMVLAGKILKSECGLTQSKNTTWARSTYFDVTIMKLVRSSRLSLSFCSSIIIWIRLDIHA